MEMPKENLLKNKYKLEIKIAQGGMSSIYLCTNVELGTKWIAKHIDKKYTNLMYEEEILKKLNHISLPKIIDICEVDSGAYIIESYIEGVSLQKKLEYLGALSLDKVIDYSLQLCEVLIYLHSIKPKPIIHRDIKPSNIIVTDYDKVVLIDFGISEEQGGARGGIQAGTKAYAAPEQLVNSSCCDTKADIYSLGIVLYQMLTGQLPGQCDLQSKNKSSIIYNKLLEISERCSRFIAEERYLRVDDIKKELLNIRNKYILVKDKEKKNQKLALALIVILSVINYISLLTSLLLF